MDAHVSAFVDSAASTVAHDFPLVSGIFRQDAEQWGEDSSDAHAVLRFVDRFADFAEGAAERRVMRQALITFPVLIESVELIKEGLRAELGKKEQEEESGVKDEL